MFEPSKDYSQSRPFKIFISLLDKWEIGAPLTHVLVYDAFKAILARVGRVGRRCVVLAFLIFFPSLSFSKFSLGDFCR
jgi:hypothetical protein